MEAKIYHVKFTFITELLGTQPSRDIATEYLAGKFIENGGMLPEDELTSLPEMVERGTTVFHRVAGQPVMWNYQIKGFVKEAGRLLSGMKTVGSVKALRSKIDNFVFVEPRFIPINLLSGTEIGYLERPLRAETAQGPRVAIARSEMIPAGAWVECRFRVIEQSPITEDILRELLTYAELKGFGQWRNGGYGQATFEMRRH